MIIKPSIVYNVRHIGTNLTRSLTLSTNLDHISEVLYLFIALNPNTHPDWDSNSVLFRVIEISHIFSWAASPKN